MLKAYLDKIVNRHDLSLQEAEEAMGIIMTGQATPSQIGAYLTALRMKGETVAEIAGSARAMKRVVEPVHLELNGEPLFDTCGTGGDASHSFNISTASAFILAGTGRKVAKHGNRAASSKCGSADVLADLGVNLDLTPKDVAVCIREVGIGFMFAPKFHPAMKYAVGPRKELGMRTIFNILGPLTNPANASHQLIGVYDADLTETIAHVLGNLGVEKALVVHGHGGLDELAVSGPNLVSKLDRGQVSSFELDPSDLGFIAAPNGDLLGGTPTENAKQMLAILSDEDRTALRDVVLLNAAAAISLDHGDLKAGLAEAEEALENGAAHQKLLDLIKVSHQVGSHQPA